MASRTRWEPFIDDRLIENARKALQAAGLELVEHNLVIASKREAQECFSRFKKMDDIDAVILFSGTWVWAAHLVAALRTSPLPGKGFCFGQSRSQGAAGGGLVMHGALKEVGIRHRFVYGSYDDRAISAGSCPTAGQPREEPAEHEHVRRVRRPRHGSVVRRGRSLAVDASLRRGHRLARHDGAYRDGRADHPG